MALARWERTITDEAGDILPGAQVTVREEGPGAPLATIFSDRAGATPLANPFTAHAVTAKAAFHAAGGAYRIDVSQGGFSDTLRYVGIGTAAESDLDGYVTLPFVDEVAVTYSPLLTRYNADPASGFFATWDMLASRVLTLTLDDPQGTSGDGGWRSLFAMWHNDNDVFDYEAESPSYRTISDVLHIGVFGKNDGAGSYELQYKDLHAITAHAIGRIGWDERGTGAFVGDNIQFGEGVCFMEFGSYNPAGSPEQSKHMAGMLTFVAGKQAAADATHFVRGLEVINIGKLATAVLEGFSAGTDGDNGQFDYYMKGDNVTVALGAIYMPDSAAGNVGTRIIYDTGDYTEFERSSSTYRWALGNSAILLLDASALFPAGAASLGLASFPWTNAFFASNSYLDFGNNDFRLTHSSNALTISGGALVAAYQGLQVGSGYVREALAANRTYYVRTDGSDSNTGLADNAGGAFLTLQKAWDVVQDQLDLNGYDVTIDVQGGTYTAGITANGPVVGGGEVIILGDAGTPTNILISATSANAFAANFGARFRVRGLEMRTTTGGNCLQATFGGVILFDTVNFGDCAGNHCEAFLDGAIYGDDDYTISGDAGAHLHAYSGGLINLNSLTGTLSGTPAFSNFFVGVAVGHVNCAAVTWSGGATGSRFRCHKNGHIETGGAGLSYFPGNAAGTFDSGGTYDALVQGFTFTLADAGANAFFGWDDAAGAYENLTVGEAQAIIAPASASYSPTATPLAGAFTTHTVTGRQTTVGKHTFVSIILSITNVGTANGQAVDISLPNTAAQMAILNGRDSTLSGLQLQGLINASGTAVRVWTTGGAGPCATGATLNLSGWYENT